ncbi:TerB family tellurite resistance protein [Aestuariibacter sp. AA17]|uniref:TerB family tellurite resistance protein n=1 Tax=Fluctibacter corallii TaxID=2984329 RepID=A0ABT3AA78_9ALTE|nr:TerB family tellurite resistance protein [Aestuariibacter sp. AA17]MCV2885559.1 TerB family tellurite resistance protein [Aestuariibacter sp. AA17]
MLKSVKEWFRQSLSSEDGGNTSHSVELCTAVLLYEIMRADHQLTPKEREACTLLIRSHFNLPEDEIATLLKASHEQASQAVDLVEYTRVINQHCDIKEKEQILTMLWQMAFSDHKLDPHEEHLIRKLADLLYLPHSQFIKTKLNVVSGQ